MNIVRKIFVLFNLLISLGYKAQIPCADSLSPTFQLTTTILSPPVNGFCQVKITILNPSGYMGGVAFPCIKYPGSQNCVQQYSIIAVVPGVWTIMVVDASSFCATTQTVQINNLPAPVISVAASNSSICYGDFATLTATGGITYTWNTSATSASISVNPAITSIFNVSGTAGNGCTNTASLVLNINPLPTLTLSADRNSICENEEVVLSVDGAVTYTWNTLQTTANITVTPLATMAYTVSGTNQYGCKFSNQVLIFVSGCTEVKRLNDSQGEIKIFPSPVNDCLNLRISSQNSLEDFTTACIYNQIGQKLREEAVKFSISTENLANGVYFLELKGSNVLIKKRFVVAH